MALGDNAARKGVRAASALRTTLRAALRASADPWSSLGELASVSALATTVRRRGRSSAVFLTSRTNS